MKMRTQIITLGMAGTALAMLVGGAGLITGTRLSTSLEDSVTASAALQASQRADMMHDAVRGDTLLGMVGALRADPAAIEEAQKELDSHSRAFREALTQLAALPLDDASRQALAKVDPLVVSYLDAARQTLQASRITTPPSSSASTEQFQQAFEVLEHEMAALSQAIEQRGQRIDDEAHQLTAIARWVIASALLFAVLGTGGMAWWSAGA